MKSTERSLDLPNWLISAGEIGQDIRDRRLLGASAVAGAIEDLMRPKYPNFVRARWARINNVVAADGFPWSEVQAAENAGSLPKNKNMAVVVGTDSRDIWDLLDDERLETAWSAAAYEYRGVTRAGILPDEFGGTGSKEAVAMLAGKNTFDVSMGLVSIKDRVNGPLDKIRRREIQKGTLFIPGGVEILDVLPAEKLAEQYPDVPLV